MKVTVPGGPGSPLLVSFSIGGQWHNLVYKD